MKSSAVTPQLNTRKRTGHSIRAFSQRVCCSGGGSVNTIPELETTMRPALMVIVAILAMVASGASSAERPPNLVCILTDNQGAWTLGCYGNPDIRTPNIDKLASQGMRMTRAFSSNPVCSPTRATYLTGLIPSQHGVHSYLGGERPNAQVGPDA